MNGQPGSGRYPPEARRIALADWPEADREAWHLAITRGRDALEMNGSATHLRVTGHDGLIGTWGRYLRFLKLIGELDPAAGPATRVTPRRLGAWLAVLRGRQIATSTHRSLVDLSRILMHLAPGQDWAWVRRHPGRPTPREVRAAKRPIETFDPWQLLGALQARAVELEALPRDTKAALEMRDIVMVAVDLLTGLRSSNLAMLTLDRHVEERGGRYYFTFKPEETKTDAALDLRLEEPAASLLRRYLTEWRPLLLGPRTEEKAVWVKSNGRAMQPAVIHYVFQRVTAQLIGRAIRPHLMRHTMATELLTDDPTNLHMAGAGLAHRGTRSVNQTYDRSGNAGAFRYWQALGRGRGG